jgi:hypothetical protein
MGGAGAVSSQVVHDATRGIHRRPTTTLSTWGECQRIGTEAPKLATMGWSADLRSDAARSCSPTPP